VQQIVPSAGACGTHAFHPSLASAPPSVVDDEDVQGDDENLVGMEIESGGRSASQRKRKFSALAPDSITPGTISRGSSRAASSCSKSRRTESQSSTQATTSSITFATEVTLATALTNMQGSINRLADVFEKSMVAPEPATRKDEAVKRLQEVEEHLSMDEQLKIIKQFGRDRSLGGTYLSLINEPLRKAWLCERLNESV
jgi:hypothetical protein